MIDIHTHILPGVDDGARNFEEAMQLLWHAAKAGTREIILTPHCAPSYGFWNFDGEELDYYFRQLWRAVDQEELDIRLHPGMEVLYEGKEEMLYHKEEYCTLCHSRYLLMEYYFDVEESEFLEGIQTAQACGFIPVVAHPERYTRIQKEPDLLKQGRGMEALFQVNKSSLKGSHGEKAWKVSHWLLEQEMADFIASDAHDLQRRDSSLRGVEEYVRRQYGKDKADKIFKRNPRAIIEDRALSIEKG